MTTHYFDLGKKAGITKDWGAISTGRDYLEMLVHQELAELKSKEKQGGQKKTQISAEKAEIDAAIATSQAEVDNLDGEFEEIRTKIKTREDEAVKNNEERTKKHDDEIEELETKFKAFEADIESQLKELDEQAQASNNTEESPENSGKTPEVANEHSESEKWVFKNAGKGWVAFFFFAGLTFISLFVESIYTVGFVKHAMKSDELKGLLFSGVDVYLLLSFAVSIFLTYTYKLHFGYILDRSFNEGKEYAGEEKGEKFPWWSNFFGFRGKSKRNYLSIWLSIQFILCFLLIQSLTAMRIAEPIVQIVEYLSSEPSDFVEALKQLGHMFMLIFFANLNPIVGAMFFHFAFTNLNHAWAGRDRWFKKWQIANKRIKAERKKQEQQDLKTKEMHALNDKELQKVSEEERGMFEKLEKLQLEYSQDIEKHMSKSKALAKDLAELELQKVSLQEKISFREQTSPEYFELVRKAYDAGLAQGILENTKKYSWKNALDVVFSGVLIDLHLSSSKRNPSPFFADSTSTPTPSSSSTTNPNP